MSIMLKGIDVSEWQGDVDWAKVRKSGIDFAILRAGYGREEAQRDKRFEENYRNAAAAGIKLGAYHYSYAKSAAEAEREAEVFLKWVKGKSFSYPVYFDIEDNSLSALSRDEVTAIAEAFCKKVEAAGYFVGIYANKYWLENRLLYERISPYTLWLAHYTEKTNYGKPFEMWQYADDGRVDGIDGNVDLNYCYRDFPSVIENGGFNGNAAGSGESGSEADTDANDYVTVTGLVYGYVTAADAMADKNRAATVPKGRYRVMIRHSSGAWNIGEGNLYWINPKTLGGVSAEITVGTRVVLNGAVYADSYGNSKGLTFTDRQGVITLTAPGRICPYHFEKLGWVKAEDVTKI